MLGLKYRRRVSAAIAGGTVAMTGCVDRVIVDLSDSGADDSADSGETETGGYYDTDSYVDPDPTTTTAGPTGDPTGDPTGPVSTQPQLINVVAISPQTLELYFTEPMAAPSAVDPSSFRLSLAYSYYYDGKYGAYGGTYYSDLSRFTGGEYCYDYCSYCYKYYDEEYCYKYYGGDYCEEYCYYQSGPPINVISIAQSSYADRLLVNLDTPLTSTVCNGVNNYVENWRGGGMFLHYGNLGTPVTDAMGELLPPIADHWVIPPRPNYAYTEGYFTQMVPFIPITCPF